MQHGCGLAPGKAELPGNGLDGVQIPIPAEKHPALCDRQGVQEAVQQLFQFFALDLILHTAGAGNTLLQLLQGQGQFAAAPLFRVPFSPAVDGDAACDLSQKGGEDGRTVGRHGVPRVVIGIVDALLGVLPAAKDAEGNAAEIAAVFCGGLRDRRLRPAPI